MLSIDMGLSVIATSRLPPAAPHPLHMVFGAPGASRASVGSGAGALPLWAPGGALILAGQGVARGRAFRLGCRRAGCARVGGRHAGLRALPARGEQVDHDAAAELGLFHELGPTL